jgi:hypothetical protein
MTGAELRKWVDHRLSNPVKRGISKDDWQDKPIVKLLRLHSKVVDKLIELTDVQVLFHEEILEASKTHAPLFSDILTTANQSVQIHNGRLLFVYLPIFAHWLPKYSDVFQEARKRTLRVVREAGIDVLDFKETLDRQADVFRFYAEGRKGGHFSVEGYGLLAKEVQKYLQRYGL